MQFCASFYIIQHFVWTLQRARLFKVRFIADENKELLPLFAFLVKMLQIARELTDHLLLYFHHKKSNLALLFTK